MWGDYLILKKTLKKILTDSYRFIFLIGFSFVAQSQSLEMLSSPIVFQGDEKKGYRDPAVLYHQGRFHLFFTMVKTENEKIFSYTAYSQSDDLIHWSEERILTPKDQSLNFSSPGNIIFFQGEWILCLQTYPRPNHTTDQEVRYGNRNARLYTMRSKDLKNWSLPTLLKVKGNDIAESDMGRMIDPYLLEDREEPGKWWCFYKQNGVSMSYSYNLIDWTFFGSTQSGENVCVLKENGEYIMFHSPSNGIGIKRSKDLVEWSDWGDLITLNQKQWSWAKGRVSAGTVVDLRADEKWGKYLMFFHGSGPKTEGEGDFDKNASLGIAWSDDLVHWEWPKN